MAKRRRNPIQAQTEDESSSFDALFFSEKHVCDTSSSPEKPVQRNAANARERARMRVLSKAFSRLKTSLPWVPPDTKLSKLDTLRLAATYIAHLRKILKEDNDQELQRDSSDSQKIMTNHPITFTWPFTINNRPSYGDDMTTSAHDNKEMDFTVRDVQNSYESYPPCEYMTLGYSELPRRDVLGHYLQ